VNKWPYILTRLTSSGRRGIWGRRDVQPQLLPSQPVAQPSPLHSSADAKKCVRVVGGVIAWCEQMTILTQLTNNGRRRIWGWCDVLPHSSPVQSVAQFSPLHCTADAMMCVRVVGGVIAWCEQMAILTRLTNNGRGSGGGVTYSRRLRWCNRRSLGQPLQLIPPGPQWYWQRSRIEQSWQVAFLWVLCRGNRFRKEEEIVLEKKRKSF